MQPLPIPGAVASHIHKALASLQPRNLLSGSQWALWIWPPPPIHKALVVVMGFQKLLFVNEHCLGEHYAHATLRVLCESGPRSGSETWRANTTKCWQLISYLTQLVSQNAAASKPLSATRTNLVLAILESNMAAVWRHFQWCHPIGHTRKHGCRRLNYVSIWLRTGDIEEKRVKSVAATRAYFACRPSWNQIWCFYPDLHDLAYFLLLAPLPVQIACRNHLGHPRVTVACQSDSGRL
jgi:hypothetical protein